MASTPFAGAARRLKDGRFSLGAVSNAELELARGNPNLIWGWKRDVGPASRIIYFGGQLVAENDEAILSRWYVFYRHRAPAIIRMNVLFLTTVLPHGHFFEGEVGAARHERRPRHCRQDAEQLGRVSRDSCKW
jgi:hypothetical protein